MENKLLIQEIKKLREKIKPRPEWKTLSRDLLLQQINPQEQYHAVRIGVGGYFNLFIKVFQQRIMEPAVVMLLILGTFLGSSLAINAAFYSLPGEPLYKVKIALESTHAVLTAGDGDKAELKVEFAQKRMSEFDKIVAQPNLNPQVKKNRIKEVIKEFQSNVVAVNDHLHKINESINQEDGKEQTVQMAISVSSKANDLVKSLNEKADSLDLIEVEKQEVKKIIDQAVISAQELVDTADQIVTGIDNSAEEVSGDDAVEIKKEGKVEGVSTEDENDEEITDEDDKDNEDNDVIKNIEENAGENIDEEIQETPE